MSSYFSRKHLEYQKSQEGGPIDTDVYCRSCGYNARGLRYGRACPECGTPIASDNASGPSRTDVLTSGSSENKRTWRLALSLLVWSLVTAVIMRGVFTLMWFGSTLPAYEIAAISGLLISIAWCSGIWMAFTAAGLQESRLIRHAHRIARWSQFGWVIGYGILTLSFLTSTGPGSTGAISAVLLHAAAFGGAMIAIMLLSRIADDAECENAVVRFRRGLYLLPVASLILVLGTGPMLWIFVPLYGMVLLVWGYAMALVCMGLLEMLRHVNWTLQAGLHASGREGRIAERRAELLSEAELAIRPVSTERPGEIAYDDQEAKKHGSPR